jgi:D-lyxose ketol-isomerase
MLSEREVSKYRNKASEYLRRAAIVLRPDELAQMEVADFGLGRPAETGLQVVVYVNTERVCAKEIIMLPRQTCPEHRHPPTGGGPGKEETFRCRWGRVFLYVPGEKADPPSCDPPPTREAHYTVWHEIVLEPGDQYTLMPDALHWFQAGDEGAVVSEFSTRSTDEADMFTDPEIQRLTMVQ